MFSFQFEQCIGRVSFRIKWGRGEFSAQSRHVDVLMCDFIFVVVITIVYANSPSMSFHIVINLLGLHLFGGKLPPPTLPNWTFVILQNSAYDRYISSRKK